MSSSQKFDYYETLQLTKNASQQQIKQAYKKLALIHHPDKNQGAQHAMIKFRQISQAYSVLNDPKKRDNYDKYGVADLEGLDFQQFMGNFGEFQDFLNQVLSFNTFDAMFTGMKKNNKKGNTKTRGRAKGRNKNMPSNAEMNNLTKLLLGGGGGIGMQNSLEMAMMEAMLNGGLLQGNDLDFMQQQLQKIILESDDDQDEDEEDLTEEQMQILSFGEKNIQKKKVGKKKKKTQISCKFDKQVIEQDEILMHFSEKHMKQFKQWQQQNMKSKPTSEVKKQSVKKQQQQIQY